LSAKGQSIAFILSIVGAILIILNGLWIAYTGSPIVLSSYPVSSVTQLFNTTSINATSFNTASLRATSFWARISLGIPGYAENSWLAFWLIIAAINLLCGILLFVQPKKQVSLSYLVILCSMLSMPIGGGFIIGFVLGIIGGLVGVEWPRPLKETFAGKCLRALKLDSSLFKAVSIEPKSLSQGVWLLIAVNILSGLGFGIYNLTLTKTNNSFDAVFKVLLLGQVTFDISIFTYPLIYVGVAIMKWLILSTLIYVVGDKLLGSKRQFNEVAPVVAFAYVPVALQVFLPLIFSNQSVQWGMAMFIVTNVWMILALVIGVRQSLEISVGKAIGSVLFCGGIYWIIDYLWIVPYLEIPGVWFILKPATFVLLLFSIGTILAALMGTFTRRKTA